MGRRETTRLQENCGQARTAVRKKPQRGAGEKRTVYFKVLR